MPRSARKESGCGIYHVMMRGVNRQAIFDDDEDCRRFMDILADLPFQHDDDGRLLPIRTCVIYAWCLMMNHFHLLVMEKQKRQMKQSLEVYIQGVKDEMRAEERMK